MAKKIQIKKMQLFTNKDKKKSFFFLILGWLGFFFLKKKKKKLRAFTVMILKILVFSNSKSYFIYFTTLLYNTPTIKCFFFLITSFKII